MDRSPLLIGKLETVDGTVVVAGTAIPVQDIYDHARAGCSVSEILVRYPALTVDDVLEALVQGLHEPAGKLGNDAD